jgi:hypothetical protein
MSVIAQPSATELQEQVDKLRARVDELERILEGVTRDADDLVIAGANLHIRNGSGKTYAKNGKGNLIIGYNEPIEAVNSEDRSGSHNLVIGQGHSYSGASGLISGYDNNVSGSYSVVLSGVRNTARRSGAVVIGGIANASDSAHGVVVGGELNIANDVASVVVGGSYNVTAGRNSSVSGGSFNHAEGYSSSINGGYSNIAEAMYASVNGGGYNNAAGSGSAVSGGFQNTIGCENCTVGGGANLEFPAYPLYNSLWFIGSPFGDVPMGIPGRVLTNFWAD